MSTQTNGSTPWFMAFNPDRGRGYPARHTFYVRKQTHPERGTYYTAFDTARFPEFLSEAEAEAFLVTKRDANGNVICAEHQKRIDAKFSRVYGT
jgi:hypothetical protein